MTTSSSTPAMPIITVGKLIAAAFALAGLLGFIPGITTHYDEMAFGHGSGAMLLGVFLVSILHNIVHLAFGVIGWLMSSTASGARSFLLGGGLLYLALWLFGLFVDHGSKANFVPLNSADNWLHLGLGAVMVLSGLLITRRRQDA